MAKRKMIKGRWHRLRRGKWVPIPEEWLGRTVGRQKIARRASKHPRKGRMQQEFRDKGWRRPNGFVHPDWRTTGQHPRNQTERHLRKDLKPDLDD